MGGEENVSPAPHRLESATIESAALGRAVEATVLVPDREPPAGGFPVLYLLHGAFSHHREWAQQVPLAALCAAFPMLVVTPEAANSLYLDGDDGQRYADFTLWDVPALVEARYPVRRDRGGRALAGLSMGGFGALNLGLSHPERYAVLGSLSGAFGMTWWNLGKRPPFLAALGPEGSFVRAHFNPWRVLERAVAAAPAAWPRIGLWVGRGDDPDVVEANRSYHASLERFGVAHGYGESGGGHDWDYWRTVTPDLLAFVADALGIAP
jgi:S-formylglutathione hydrolase FrmB